MRLVPREIPSLPPLAWCARVRHGSDDVTVLHGRGVDTVTRPHEFFEGAWDGPIGADPAAATTLIGSAGRAAPEGVLFASPTDLTTHLFAIRRDDLLVISNSIVFALVEGGAAPDRRYCFYEQDMLDVFRLGTTRRERHWLPMADGRRLHLYGCTNLLVTKDLTVTPVGKTVAPAPTTFEDYVDAVQSAMEHLFHNAASPERRRRYTPIVTVSRGYDSPAVAALARRIGCRDAITLTTQFLTIDDNGRPIAERLGLAPHELDGRGYLTSLAPREFAEFLACPGEIHAGAAAVLAPAAELLEGRVLLSGMYGDQIWGGNACDAWVIPNVTAMSGGDIHEFRLRAGFLYYPVPYTGSAHQAAVNAISRSPEMAPWSIGGAYDRPIPRRIVEQAGIPRDWFGSEKVTAPMDSLPLTTAAIAPDYVKRYTREDRSIGLAHECARSLFRAAEQLGRRSIVDWLEARLPLRTRSEPSVFPHMFAWSFEVLEQRYRT